MNEQTQLDLVHATMAAEPGNDTARLAFYGVLADSELFVLLEGEAAPDSISPEILDIEGDRFALVFDREERLSDFTKQPAPYAALPGRLIAAMLAGRGIGLGLNLGVAPSSILIPAGAMDWLQDTLTHRPQQGEGRVEEVLPPEAGDMPLADVLEQKLGFAQGLVQAVFLANARFEDGRENALLGLVGAPDPARDALAHAAQEALIFSGLEDQRLDVVFARPGSALAGDLARSGQELKLPPAAAAPAPRGTAPPAAPGSDPDKPPILK